MSNFSVQIDNPSSFHPVSLISFRILPPEADLLEDTCSLHIYYKLPSSVFIDPYELVQRQQAYTFVQWGYADLEKPVNAIKSNVTLLINVNPPRIWTDNTSGLSFDVNVPLHARYGIPSPDTLSKSPSGTYHDVALEIPSAFIACREERLQYSSTSPSYLSESQLLEAGLQPDMTTFLHLNYSPSTDHVDTIRIPLGHGQDLHWVQSGTAIIVLLSFICVTVVALQTAARLNFVSRPVQGKID
ncbi:hypothetical protein AGABI2DRAFT_120044 [Agaricus bisporus var. bisporus H97]|uniref:hypothetical protein n=1 Tax=Agaricus bisporus var. bisporus (strain H97 / ATCC MYA-4626 / FGSC 10389) TaxID=936046 RepID=UPI00029F70CC|nr:hypothetical protein AGABI2DRAFT_120044 [Agaricus bisporus var. bisporus H97]EKV45076.1 hypothetical protein AGABI2DRAFT_120044 [Agaricus bisporus var. bisporus H97]